MRRKWFAQSGKPRILDALSQEINLADEVLRGMYRESEEARLLSTLPGVGIILSPPYSPGEGGKFHGVKHLSSFAALVPSTHQTGDRQRHGRITK
ncbi:MAG: IS110 family transposase [Actinobacteria bacterium]|nr:IS110 family transposase [Actinomycetota bacterium]